MTIASNNSTTAKLPGNGVIKTFDFTIKVIDDVSELKFYLSINGAAVAEITSNYTIDLNDDQDANPGGTLNYPTTGDAITANDYIVGNRDGMPYTQVTFDRSFGELLNQEAIEKRFDKDCAERQQLWATISRAVIADPGSTTSISDETIEAYIDDKVEEEFAAAVQTNVHEEIASPGQTTITVSGFVLAAETKDIWYFVDGKKKWPSLTTRTSDTVLTVPALVGGELLELDNRTSDFSGRSTEMLTQLNSIEALCNTIDSNVDDVETLCNTIDGNTDELEQAQYNQMKVYPTLGVPIVVTAVDDANSWTIGAKSTLVPASTITTDFSVRELNIEVKGSLSTGAYAEIFLYKGASDTLFFQGRLYLETPLQFNISYLPVNSDAIAANEIIKAAIATQSNNGETVYVSVAYIDTF